LLTTTSGVDPSPAIHYCAAGRYTYYPSMPIDAARIFHGKIGIVVFGKASRPRLNVTVHKMPVRCNNSACKQRATFLSAENVQ